MLDCQFNLFHIIDSKCTTTWNHLNIYMWKCLDVLIKMQTVNHVGTPIHPLHQNKAFKKYVTRSVFQLVIYIHPPSLRHIYYWLKKLNLNRFVSNACFLSKLPFCYLANQTNEQGTFIKDPLVFHSFVRLMFGTLVQKQSTLYHSAEMSIKRSPAGYLASSLVVLFSVCGWVDVLF